MTLYENRRLITDAVRRLAAEEFAQDGVAIFERRLAGDDELVCPFVFLRGDRRGRSAIFVEYMNDLYERGRIDRLHVAGENARTFARRVDPPATVHDSRRESPAAVIDAVLAENQPVMTMANTVHPFMRALVAELNDRTATDFETVADTDPLRAPAGGAPGGVAAGDADGVTDPTAGVETGGVSSEARLEVYRDRADEWRWRLVHRNGNILADGTRGRASQEAVETVLGRLTGLVGEAPVVEDGSAGDGADGTEGDADLRFELYEDAAEEWRWRLRDADGDILADSGEGYASRGNVRRAIKSVKRTFPGANVELSS